MMKLKWILLATLALAFLAAACSSAASQGQEGLPSFAYNSRESTEGYRFAVDNQDLISQIPCYCGCSNLSTGQNHKSLQNCYINDDGSFTDHASTCDICNKIALDVKAWKEQGSTVKSIRERVDAKYNEYGEPTDTPPVQ